MTKEDKHQVQLTTDSHKRVTGAKVTYKTDNGKELKIKLNWKTKDAAHGSYCQSTEHYLQTEASVKKLFLNKTIYSHETLVGRDEWQAGMGNTSQGAQTFKECMEDPNTFQHIDEKNPLLPFLKRAQKDVSSAIKAHEQEKARHQGNNILFEKIRQEISHGK